MPDWINKYFDGSLWGTSVVASAGMALLSLGMLLFASFPTNWVFLLLCATAIGVLVCEFVLSETGSEHPLTTLGWCGGIATGVLWLLGSVPFMLGILIMIGCAIVVFPNLAKSTWDRLRSWFHD